MIKTVHTTSTAPIKKIVKPTFEKRTIYTKPTGSDANAGTENLPVFSLKRAFELLRMVDSNEYIIFMSPGVYKYSKNDLSVFPFENTTVKIVGSLKTVAEGVVGNAQSRLNNGLLNISTMEEHKNVDGNIIKFVTGQLADEAYPIVSTNCTTTIEDLEIVDGKLIKRVVDPISPFNLDIIPYNTSLVCVKSQYIIETRDVIIEGDQIKLTNCQVENIHFRNFNTVDLTNSSFNFCYVENVAKIIKGQLNKTSFKGDGEIKIEKCNINGCYFDLNKNLIVNSVLKNSLFSGTIYIEVGKTFLDNVFVLKADGLALVVTDNSICKILNSFQAFSSKEGLNIKNLGTLIIEDGTIKLMNIEKMAVQMSTQGRILSTTENLFLINKAQGVSIEGCVDAPLSTFIIGKTVNNTIGFSDIRVEKLVIGNPLKISYSKIFAKKFLCKEVENVNSEIINCFEIKGTGLGVG